MAAAANNGASRNIPAGMPGASPCENQRSEAELESQFLLVILFHALFAEAFPGEASPITLQHVVQALASFERTLISGRAPLDQYLYSNDQNAISTQAKRGYELFNTEKLECFHCHVGFNLPALTAPYISPPMLQTHTW